MDWHLISLDWKQKTLDRQLIYFDWIIKTLVCYKKFLFSKQKNFGLVYNFFDLVYNFFGLIAKNFGFRGKNYGLRTNKKTSKRDPKK